jgi:protein-L-isoaspartate(D-aspartate) O-methyltransferase
VGEGGGHDDPALRAGFVLELRRSGVRDHRILTAMELVPRRLFVPLELSEFAYADRALPIACGQSIERPSLAARLLSALELRPGDRVLEIGTGTGWTTAVLARLGGEVTSLERYATLVRAARARLVELDLGRHPIRHADGLGAPQEARFHRIIAFGAIPEVPRAWLAMLAREGSIIAAVGPPEGSQQLMRITRAASGVSEADLGPIRIVPLTPGLSRAS